MIKPKYFPFGEISLHPPPPCVSMNKVDNRMQKRQFAAIIESKEKEKAVFDFKDLLYHETVWETKCLCKTIGTTRLSCQAFVNVL